MIVLSVVRAVALAATGLSAGIFLGYRAGVQYATPELDPSSFVQLQQIIHVHYVKLMPPLVLGALVSSTLWAVLVRSHWRTAEFWLVAVSALALLTIAIATRTVSVPLNDQLMTWSPTSPPADLHEIWAPWDRINTLRSVLASAALVFEAVALTTKATMAS